MTLHTLRIEAIVALDHADRLTDAGRVEGLLIAISDAAGPGQSAYDPNVATLDGPEGGLSGACLFPGGHVTVHTFASKGRIPGRYVLEVTAGEPLDTGEIILLAERRLGLPTDYRAQTLTRGWTA